MTNSHTDVPLALYVHFPWCVKKCPYCDFNSHAVRDNIPELAYLEKLLGDLDSELEDTPGRIIQSVFIGGGTPSLISPSTIAALLAHLKEAGRLSTESEITLEANPGASDSARFLGYRAAGVNRLSIGVQSFNDRSLKHIGRIHDGNQSRDAIRAARSAGFENINIDLMFALPEQSERDALADVDIALTFAPEHLSYYQLTLEPNTAFHNDPPELPDEDTAEVMHQSAIERINQAGLTRYEVSAFALKGRQSRHNRNYWEFGDYLGVGAGAHGKVTSTDGVTRYSKPRHPKAYLDPQTVFRCHVTKPTGDDLLFEFMLNALRLTDGFDRDLFGMRTGLSPTRLAEQIKPLINEGLLRDDSERLCATESGLRYLNNVLERLLPNTSINTTYLPHERPDALL
ncbi:MAG: YggW family oxidoreductase [marine bacterium B5-7]|nr:MAG: YggW family oxidoreductase [marine bacterium B5-7]